MKSSNHNHAWRSTLSWLWHSLHISKQKNNKDDDGLYWIDPIAWMWHNYEPPRAPKSRDDFLTKVTILCDAILFYEPCNHNVKSILNKAGQLKNKANRISKYQKEFCKSAGIETYQALIDEQTEYLQDIHQCREEVDKLKKSMSIEWIETLQDYFTAFDSRPMPVDEKYIN